MTSFKRSLEGRIYWRAEPEVLLFSFASPLLLDFAVSCGAESAKDDPRDAVSWNIFPPSVMPVIKSSYRNPSGWFRLLSSANNPGWNVIVPR